MNRRWTCIWLPYLSTDRIVRESPHLARERLVTARRIGQTMRIAAVGGGGFQPSVVDAGRRVDVPIDHVGGAGTADFQSASPSRLPEADSSQGARLCEPPEMNQGLEGRRDATKLLNMTVAAARAAVPGLTVLDHDPAADLQTLGMLADWARHLGPFVSLFSDDAIVVETSGSSHLFGGEPEMLRATTQALRSLGFSARLAVASNPRLAHAQATSGAESFERVPLWALSPPAGALEAAESLGLNTVGELLNLPRNSLSARLGSELTERLSELMGEAELSLIPHIPEAGCRERMAFDPPLDSGTSLLFAVKRMVDRLAERLRGSGTGTRELELVIHPEAPATPVPERIRTLFGGESARPAVRVHCLNVRASEPVADSRIMMLLLTSKLEGLDLGDRERVSLLELSAAKREALPSRGRGLFDPRRSSAADNGLPDLLAQLTARLGSDGAVRAVATGDWRPSHAWRAVPFLEGEPEAPVEKKRTRRKQWRDYDGRGYDAGTADFQSASDVGEASSRPEVVRASSLQLLGSGGFQPSSLGSGGFQPSLGAATSPSRFPEADSSQGARLCEPPVMNQGLEGRRDSGEARTRVSALQGCSARVLACMGENEASDLVGSESLSKPPKMNQGLEGRRDAGEAEERTRVSALPAPTAPGLHPLRLFPQPRRCVASFRGAVPVAIDGWPVVAADGPQRLATAWWDPDPMRSDLWRITLSDGRCLLLANDLTGNGASLLGTML